MPASGAHVAALPPAPKRALTSNDEGEGEVCALSQNRFAPLEAIAHPDVGSGEAEAYMIRAHKKSVGSGEAEAYMIRRPASSKAHCPHASDARLTTQPRAAQLEGSTGPAISGPAWD